VNWHYFQMGWRSLRKNPALTLLMVAAIGFGVSAFMTTFAVFKAVSGNPMPWKSERLFVPQIDNWGPQSRGPDGEPPDLLSYTDAVALARTRPGVVQTAIYPVVLSLIPVTAQTLPVSVDGYAVNADFFRMFEVPFRYGSAWGRSDESRRENIAVLSEKTNESVFGGVNSVGREIVLNNKNYRVVGVSDDWNPQPRFYDVANSNGFKSKQPEFFIPFESAVDAQIETIGSNNCNGHAGEGWDGWLRSQCTWISYWVELPGRPEVASYSSMLRNYAQEQQRTGRFDWPPNVKLRNLTEWLDYQKVAPEESKVSLMIALAFLVVCLFNTAGLLLAKFMKRSGEIGLRRALGAKRGDIYQQFFIESAFVGFAGGCLGLLMTWIGTLNIDLLFDPDIAKLATMGFWLVAGVFLVAIVTTVLAAVYPIWRATNIQPAWQLKAG